MNKEKAEMLSTIIDLEHSLRYYQGQVERQAPVIEAAEALYGKSQGALPASCTDEVGGVCMAVRALQAARGKP